MSNYYIHNFNSYNYNTHTVRYTSSQAQGFITVSPEEAMQLSLDFKQQELEREKHEAYREQMIESLEHQDPSERYYYVEKMKAISHEEMVERLHQLIEQQKDDASLILSTKDFPCDLHLANIFLVRYTKTCRDEHKVYFSRRAVELAMVYETIKTNSKKSIEHAFGASPRLLNPLL